jgi:O-antigen ligase
MNPSIAYNPSERFFEGHEKRHLACQPHRWLIERQQAATRGRRWLAAIASIWLVVQVFDVIFTIAGSYELALAVCVAWIAVPLFFAAPGSFLRTGLSTLTAGRGRASVLLLAFMTASLASALLSGNTPKSVGYLVATIVTLILEYELCAYLGTYFNAVLRWYSVLGTLAYLPFYLRGAVAGANWGRLSVNEVDHPNHFGLVCFSIFGAAFAWRSWPIRLAICGAMIAMITAAQSRSSLVSALVMMTIFIALELKNRKAVLTMILVGGIVTIAALVFLDPISGAVSSVLNLHDQYRGAGTGLSGRVELWEAGIDIFLDHPLLGVGFRLQDEALPAMFQYAGAVHNGFLGTLVEVGLLGAIPLFWFMGIGIGKLWRDSNRSHPGSQLGISYVLGYCASAMVEPRLLNLAHPASVIAWCFLISGGIQAHRSVKQVSRGRRGLVIRPEASRFSTPGSRPAPRDWALLLKTSRDQFK